MQLSVLITSLLIMKMKRILFTVTEYPVERKHKMKKHNIE